MELHGVTNNSWVPSPIPSRNNTVRHSDSETFTKISSLDPRDTMSPVSSLSNTMAFATPSSPLEKSRKSHGGRSIWRAMKQLFSCYNPVRSNPKSKQKLSKENSASISIHMRASPSPDHSYSAMNAEERDENLKAVITYCNRSMNSGRMEDTVFKDCIPSC
ncbi:hypothetical protein PTKIN_Ptkin19aG0069300 [Pterospermum kingtungense]